MPRESTLWNALRTRQAKSWCWVNFLGLLRWAYSGKASLAAACAASSTFRGDLLVVLMLQGVPRRAAGRNPNRRRTSELFYRACLSPLIPR